MLSLAGPWMGGCFKCWVSAAVRYTGCWPCVDAELAIGQYTAGGAQNLWSEQPLESPSEDVIIELEIHEDLPL